MHSDRLDSAGARTALSDRPADDKLPKSKASGSVGFSLAAVRYRFPSYRLGSAMSSYRGMFRESELSRPFGLSVVGPSGRRPWPIRTSSDARIYFDGMPVQVEFTYPVHYVPDGRRRPVLGRVEARAPVLFRAADPSQVRTACRIEWDDADHGVTDVIHFAGKLWWSLPGKPTIDSFVAALDAGEHAAVGLLGETCVSTAKPARSEEELAARDIVCNGLDGCIASLGRGADGILVCDGQVFVREGAPVNVLWNGYHNQSITSIGISPVIVELASSRRNPAYEDASNELIFGRTFEAADGAGISAFAEGKGISFATDAKVDILLPDLLRVDPITVQLDATLQKLLRLFSIPRPGTVAGREEITVELRRLRDVVERDVSASERANALKHFAHWVSGPEEWKKKFRVERLFAGDAIDRMEAECSRRSRASLFSETDFSEEEEAAIDRHFGPNGS